MSIGVIILLIAIIYCIAFWIIPILIEKKLKNSEKEGQFMFAAVVIGFVLFFVAYMIIVPMQEPGKEKWLNSVTFLRVFWKIFACGFLSVGSLLVALGVPAGIFHLFLFKKKENSNWKTLNKEEAMKSLEEIFADGKYNKMEKIAQNAPLPYIRIAAVKKLRTIDELENCLRYERDENVRKEIEIAISMKKMYLSQFNFK